MRDLANADAFAAPDVYRQSVEGVSVSSKQIGARDIFYKREVTRLLAVLVQDGRQVVQEPGAKDCNYAGVGIEN